MYFKSRTAAGESLARKLAKHYSDRQCAIIAINDGAVLVATQIAIRLRCALMLLLTETIDLPREPLAIANVSQDGGFTYNQSYSPSEIEDLQSEYRTYIDQARVTKTHKLNELIGRGSLIKRSLLVKRDIIVVSDGLSNGSPLDAIIDFLKPLEVRSMVVATPMASVQAIDRMHLLFDQIYCLSIIEDYITTDHYYEINDVPNHEVVIQTVENILKNWPAAVSSKL